jgi:hypothetical protein
VQEMMAPVMDMARPTRKEEVVDSLRPYPNLASTVKSSYVSDPTNIPKRTLKELVENSAQYPIIQRNVQQNGGGYMVNEHQPVTNARTQTLNYSYTGISSATSSAQKPRDFTAERNQRNNQNKPTMGYTTGGNINTFQGVDARVDSARKQVNRNQQMYVAAPDMPALAPSVETLGYSSVNLPAYRDKESERNNQEILKALKSNPYALSITG